MATTFSQLDPLLRRWSQDRGVPLFTSHRGEPVRSFELVGSCGATRCQIWVETGERVTVSVWDYGSRKRELDADVSNLYERLDEAWRLGGSWL